MAVEVVVALAAVVGEFISVWNKKENSLPLLFHVHEFEVNSALEVLMHKLF